MVRNDFPIIPWKYDSDFVANMRMPLSKFDDYYASVSSLKEKYKDRISIKIGLKCEYFPNISIG